jgi:copper(I)-binding protein
MIESEPLKEGETVPIELELDDGEKLSFEAAVKDE